MDNKKSSSFIPYGRHYIDQEDIESVIEVLKSDFLTTGPFVEKFEAAISEYTGAKHAIALSSGTAALHSAAWSLGLGPGDEVIVPSLTFAASANCILYCGASPVFADVDIKTGLIDLESVKLKINGKTKAIIGVDYSGVPCDYQALRKLCDLHRLSLIADCAHSLGAKMNSGYVSAFADCAIYSFHPVKHITTAEGGMVTTNRKDLFDKICSFRNHGIDNDARKRASLGSWHYELNFLGYNYRLSDLQCALGLSQLKKANKWLNNRETVALKYIEAFKKIEKFDLFEQPEGFSSAWHLFVLKLSSKLGKNERNELFEKLRKSGIGVNVHYIPVHLHPYYLKEQGTYKGLAPVTEYLFDRILSLPIYGTLSSFEQDYIIEKVLELSRDL